MISPTSIGCGQRSCFVGGGYKSWEHRDRYLVPRPYPIYSLISPILPGFDEYTLKMLINMCYFYSFAYIPLLEQVAALPIFPIITVNVAVACSYYCSCYCLFVLQWDKEPVPASYLRPRLIEILLRSD